MNEKYIPLYRKYRPQTLEEIVGQEHIKKSLTNAIELNKIAHAYLFTGPRGTGKTSSARILAKSLNCENGPTISPCGKCASCIDITNSTPVDVIEIDAASNRKVEDAQNILEKIQYVPVNGKYKIYIIDEVHMLTNHAFNALLKTLEEPPENVIFILATTEPQKVLDTIKSRCQKYDFKRITTEDIVKHLKYISDKEKINIDDESLMAIAKNSEGGMRDSIALLDQLSVLGSAHMVTIEDINSLLGRISFDILVELGKAIISNNPQNAVEILEKIYNAGNEPSQILLNMLEFFKNILLAKTCDKKIVLELTQYSEKQVEDLIPFTSKLETQQIVFLTEKISNYIKEIKTSTTQHLWLEVALIDMANLTENTSLLELQNRLTKLEGGIPATQSSPVAYKTAPAPIIKPEMKPVSATVVKPVPIKQETQQTSGENISQKNTQTETFSPMPKTQHKLQQTQDLSALWQSLITNIQSPSTQAVLKLAKPVMITPEKVIITFAQESFVSRVNNSPQKQSIIDACDIMFSQKNTNVIIRLPHSDDTFVKIPDTEEEKKTPDVKTQQTVSSNLTPNENTQITSNADSDTNSTIATTSDSSSDTHIASQQSVSSEAVTDSGQSNNIGTDVQISKPENKSSDTIKKEKTETDVDADVDVVLEEEPPESTAKDEIKMVSDQVNMIMKLFDGKHIE